MELRSPNFDVITDSNDKQARHVAIQLERMRAVFEKLVPTASDTAGSPIIVLALKDKKAFQALEPEAYLAKGQLNLAGLFLRAPDKNYILLRLDAEGDHPYATVYHEYTHYMLRRADEWLPLWLNEGLAEFYQNSEIRDKEVFVGQPSSDDILYLRQNRLLPLTTLLAVDHTSPYYHEEQKGSVFYAESWALTHYITMTDRQKGTNRLREYAEYLIKKEDPITAAQHAFGDLNQLQRALNDYISRSQFMMFKMNAAISVDESSFQVAPLPNADADAIRADILVYNDRKKDAQALLDTALRDDPKSALAHETMGYLKFREGDIPSAAKWYGEAVQLDSKSYLAHYYFAVMTLQSGSMQQDAEIETSLLTSIKLNPSFAPAYDTLATFYGMRNEKLDDAHMLGLHALQLEPENLQYRMNMANVLMEQAQYLSAANVLKEALRVAKTPDDRERLQGRIEQMERFQAQANAATRQASQLEIQTVVPSADGKTKTAQSTTEDSGPKYPTGDTTGPRHKAKGVLRSVHCSYPSVITLSLEQAGKRITLYQNNYYKIAFSATNFTPQGDLDPCHGIEGMKATVDYAEVSDKSVAGQIVSIELSR